MMHGELEDEVLSWLSAPTPSVNASGLEDRDCRGCGYEGEMLFESATQRWRCPACRNLLPTADPFVGCPTCDFAIFVAETGPGGTVVCPNCKCFLGCLKPKPRVHRNRRLRR